MTTIVEQQNKINELLNSGRPVTLETIAQALSVTAQEAAHLLPEGSATFAPGSDFESVWAAIAEWEKMRENLLGDENLTHTRSREYASYIMEAMETNRPFKFGGNVINTGLITNLPSNACVEVPCIADASGVQSVFIGDLPEQCAAMNRTNINPQLLAIEAAVTKKKDYIYQAAMLDPHTAAELTIDQIVSMCDDLIEAHKGWLPEYH